MGCDQATIAAIAARIGSIGGPGKDGIGQDGVWPENVDAVVAFLVVSSQWRVAIGGQGMVHTGLDYAGVSAGLEAMDIPVTPTLWSDLRVIEAAARTALNERQK